MALTFIKGRNEPSGQLFLKAATSQEAMSVPMAILLLWMQRSGGWTFSGHISATVRML